MDLLTLLLFLAGLVLLIAGAEALVRGAAQLAAVMGISPLVIGLTVVAFGTGSPELAVSFQGSWTGRSDLVVGNIVGSNISNVLLVLGIAAVTAPLMVAQQLVRWDVPLLIGVSVLFFLLALDGNIDRLDGGILFAGAIAYTVFAIWQSRRESAAVRDEYAHEYGKASIKSVPLLILFIVVGLALLVLGSYWLVEGAVALARAIGLSELVIGLTVVAVGTSLPEIATSVLASVRGQRDIAVGNVVGSNLFNILAVLGLSGLAAPDAIPIPPAALRFDIIVMTAVTIACMPIFFTGYRIDRWEGLLFLGYYAAYTAYLVLSAQEHDALPVFSAVMLWFVIPITVITLLVLVVQALFATRYRRG